ncbi:MAG TPA: hypothetical protein VID51_06615 [Solirubrobacterales bacterium]|jgi:hypothetical protein
MPFAASIAILSLAQAALVALPVARPLPAWLESLRGRWWALAPALSIVVVVGGIALWSNSATGLTYLALVAVPPLAALALAFLVHGSRLLLALAVPPLFVLAWAVPEALAGEAAATVLSGLACVALGWLLVNAVAARWLRWGIYAMAALDAALVAANLLQGPSDVLSAAAPAADLPVLQVANFGAARMGFGDLFVAALVGCLLAQPPANDADGPRRRHIGAFEARRQWVGAGLVAVLALGFDLLFFAVDTLPATVPVAVALAIVTRATRGDVRATSGPGAERAQL